jgi:hypothetical protein
MSHKKVGSEAGTDINCLFRDTENKVGEFNSSVYITNYAKCISSSETKL